MKKVLVIEDDSFVRTGLVMALRRHGYETLDAGDGVRGLELAYNQRPSIVVTDVNLPGQNGFAVLEELRTHPETAAIPVVMMTGEPHRADARYSMNRGADDYLQKPFTIEQMLAILDARLRRHDGIERALEARTEAERISAAEKIKLQSTALEAAANGIAITNRDGQILWVNQAFTALTGFSAEEIVGKNPRVLGSGRHPRDFFAEMWQTISAGRPWHGELINKRKDGSCYHEEMTITPVCDERGVVQHFIAIKQDITDRKQHELALSHKRDLLQALMENLPDYIYFKDVNSRFTRINGALARHFCLEKPEDATGKSDADFFPLRQARQKLVDERCLLATGKPILNLVERDDAPDGGKWVSSTKVPIYGLDGQISGLVGISRDITENQRVEEELRESRRFLQSALDALSSHIAILDEHGTIIKVNAAWSRFAEANSAAGSHGVGGNYLDFCRSAKGVDSDRAAVFAAGIVEVMEGKREEFHMEYPCHGPQEHRWFLGRATRFAGNGPVRVVIAHEDITERKLAEEKLRQSEANLAEGQRAAKLGCWQYNLAANQITWSDELYRIFGIQKEEFDGTRTSFLHRVVPEDQPSVLNAGREACEKGKPFEIEYCVRTPAGELKAIRETGHVRRDADGKVSGLYGTAQDVTERKRLETELFQARKMESIGQLAAGIAHEINTPTQYVGDNTRFVKDSFAAVAAVLESHEAILAAAKTGNVSPDLLEQSERLLAASDFAYLREQIPQALDETLEGVSRVAKIVKAMKEFSHPGGKEKTPADLNKAIESTATVARNEWKYVADLKMELDPALPFVPCFLGEINQAVLNLIVNAAHAIGDVIKNSPGAKGLITIQTLNEGDQVEIRVADTGTGIPEAMRSKIFEPFFTTKAVGKGTGQGLAMVYGTVVKRHGGTVTFESTVGKGTTFIVRLPLKTKSEENDQAQPGRKA